MVSEKFVEELATVLETQKEKLTDDFNLEQCGAWDSLAFISTIALIDRYYNIVVAGELLAKIRTLAELKALFIQKVA